MDLIKREVRRDGQPLRLTRITHSRVVMIEGNFQDYEEDKKRRLGAEALKPTRVKYKKLTHG